MKKVLSYAFNYCLRDIPIHLICLILSIFPASTTVNYIRGFLVSIFLGKCGKRFQLGKGVIINHPESLMVGNDCYISHNCYVQAKGKVTFSDNVIIGPMSIIASSKHIIENGVVTNKGVSAPIKIGRGTWCAGNVVISSGVCIGESVIIGAGAVVTKDIPSYSKAFGIPAQVKN